MRAGRIVPTGLAGGFNLWASASFFCLHPPRFRYVLPGPPSSLLLVHVETTCRVHCEEVIVLVHAGDNGDRALVVVFLGHLMLVVCSCLLCCPNAV